MTGNVTVVRSILIYGICLPLAVFLGYLLAQPFASTTLTTVGLVLLVLVLPLLLNWHHPLLVFSWNMNVVVLFLQGRPNLWLVMTALSLLVSVLHRTLDRQTRFIRVRSVTWPLLFLFVVILITAKMTGGIGLRTFGGETWGGKAYVFLLGAILGYFAFTGRRIPTQRAQLYMALFLLGGLTWAMASMVRFVSPSFYFLFAIFPVESMSLPGRELAYIPRMQGVPLAATAAISLMCARYGIGGIFNARKLWRPALFFLLVVVVLYGGFRTMFVTLMLLFTAQFFLEGLHRTRLLMVFLIGGLFVGVVSIPLLPRLPTSIQRSFAWLPVEIDPVVKLDTQYSAEWRVRMWKAALPDVPQYLLLGKGYAIDPTERQFQEEGFYRGFQEDYQAFANVGTYHNGPLSVIMPLGIWGVIGFLWFLGASFHVLHRNYRYGNPVLRSANAFLLAAFVAQTIMFWFVFGSFFLDLPKFCGLVGMSVSLNGGVSRPLPVTAAKQIQPRLLAAILSRPKPAFGR